MAINDAYKLVITMRFLGQTYQNTLAFRRITAPNPTQAECLTVADEWKESFRALLNNQLSYVSWKMFQVSGTAVTYSSTDCKREGGLIFEAAYSGSVLGGNATAALPPQCAMVTTLYTPFIGRRRRGRIYLPGLHEGMQADGTLGGTDVTTFNTQWTAFFAKYVGPGTNANWVLGIFSERTATGCAPGQLHPHSPTRIDAPNPGAAFADVNRFLVRSTIFTQRRRTIGVGR